MQKGTTREPGLDASDACITLITLAWTPPLGCKRPVANRTPLVEGLYGLEFKDSGLGSRV